MIIMQSLNVWVIFYLLSKFPFKKQKGLSQFAGGLLFFVFIKLNLRFHDIENFLLHNGCAI